MGQNYHGEFGARIKAIILRRLQGTTCSQQHITMDTPILGKGLGLDSVEALALITEIEAEFDIGFDDEDLAVGFFENIGTLAEVVKNKLSQNEDK